MMRFHNNNSLGVSNCKQFIIFLIIWKEFLNYVWLLILWISVDSCMICNPCSLASTCKWLYTHTLWYTYYTCKSYNGACEIMKGTVHVESVYGHVPFSWTTCIHSKFWSWSPELAMYACGPTKRNMTIDTFNMHSPLHDLTCTIYDLHV